MHMETEPAEDYKRANFSDSDEELPTLASATDKRETKDHLSIIPRTPTDRNPEVATFEELLHKRQPKTLEDILDLRFVFNKITEEKEEEDEGIGAAGYELTKHRHGVINRVLRLGQAHDANRLLSFKKSLIKKSLLKMNRPRDEQCVQMFKNIMSFMGDRHSSKDPAGHARKLVRNALKAPVGMRDELYLQICKQIRGHPNAAHCVEGWNLLLVCLYSFPPSRNIKVKQFLNAALQESKSTKEMKDRAKFALKLLPLIEKLGDRKEMPPDIEVEAVRQLKKVDVHIFMAAEATNKNEPSFHIKVDPFTTVEEAEQMCYRKLEIKFTEAFGLFEANDDAESPLVSSERLLDAVSSWDRSIDEDEDIQDVKKKKSKAKIDAAEEEHKPPEYRYLLFQAKLCLRTGGEHKVEDLIADPKAITLLYCQAKRDVIQCRIQNEETKDIENLAALKLQADEGDYMPDIHRQGFIIPKLHEYVPLKLLPKKKEGTTNEAKLRMFEQTIMDKYKKLKGFLPTVAKRNYLDFVERWTMYGATFFIVDQHNQLRCYPRILYFGISPHGVLLRNPKDGEILERWPYKDIVSWGYSETKFIVVQGDVVQQKKLVFGTHKGKMMRGLIHAYMQYIVQAKLKEFEVNGDVVAKHPMTFK